MSDNLKNIKFKVICFRHVPQNWVIGCLLARLNLAQHDLCVKSCAAEHIAEQFLGHEMRAGTGCQIPARGRSFIALRLISLYPRIALSTVPRDFVNAGGSSTIRSYPSLLRRAVQEEGQIHWRTERSFGLPYGSAWHLLPPWQSLRWKYPPHVHARRLLLQRLTQRNRCA